MLNWNKSLILIIKFVYSYEAYNFTNTIKMKNGFLIFLFIAFFSCKKDTQPIIDNRIGNYQCTETTTSMGLDSLGHYVQFSVITNNNIIVNVSSAPGSNYTININTFSFYTDSSKDDQYFAQCSSGPCNSIKFYTNNNITVYQRINNGMTIYYSGTKI